MTPGINERRLWSVSPSAIDAYEKCPRKWYYSYVLKVDRGPTPPHMAKGTSIHAALEHYHRTGEVLIEHENKDAPGVKWPVLEFVQAAIPHIPPPIKDPYWVPWSKGDGGLMLEQQGELATWTEPDGSYGPALNQYIDMVEAYPDHATITDYKTSSNARYFKTPDELSTNTQLICNAKWLLSNSDYKTVKLRHLYLLTSGKRPKAVPVEVEVTREHVEKQWQRILGIIREMAGWAKLAPENADPLEPKTDRCNDYGGCEFKPRCGFESVNGLVTVRRTTMKEGEKMSLLADMMKRAGSAAKPVTPAAPPAPAPAPAAGSTLLSKVPTAPPAAVPAPLLASKSPLLNLLKKPAAEAPSAPAEPALTPEKAQEAAVKAGYPAESPKPVGAILVAPDPLAKPEEVPTGVVPPDAPSRISTPEEVAAANPEPETKTDPASATADGEKPKRKRRTKAEMEADRAAAEAAQPKVEEVIEKAVEQVPLQMPDVQTAVSPEAIDEALAAEETEEERIRKILMTPDPAFGCGVEALFIDCMPSKGWPGERPVDLAEVMGQFNSLASSSAGVADYRLIKYQASGYLATAIKVYMKGLPRTMYVDSNAPGAAVFLETVTPYCKMIFRGVR